MSVAPDPKPAPTQSKTLTERYGVWITPIALVLLFIASNRGWLSPTQVEIIKPFVMSANENETTTETITVEKTTVPTVDPAAAVKQKPKPVPAPAPVVKPVEAVTPEDIKQWAELIKLLIEQLKPKPVPPIPPVPIPPQPIPPTPTPIDPQPPIVVPPRPIPPQPPSPSPDGLKILVCDELGKPIPSSTVEAGQLFRVSAVGSSGDIAWQNVRHGSVRLSGSTDGKEFTCYLSGGDYVEFGLTDFGQRKQLATRISANHGPIPPPRPVDPIIDPIPPLPPVPVVSGLRVILAFESSANHSREQLNILNSTQLITLLNSTCTKDAAGVPGWRRWDKDTQTDKDGDPIIRALWADVKPKLTSLPSLVIACGSQVTVQALPATEAETIALIRQTTGGSK